VKFEPRNPTGPKLCWKCQSPDHLSYACPEATQALQRTDIHALIQEELSRAQEGEQGKVESGVMEEVKGF